jgi:hypothetical protein
MEKEVWKPIPGYEDRYLASNLGRIQSKERIVNFGNQKRLSKSIILKAKCIDKQGYYTVSISRKTFNVHKLIAITFLNHKPNGNKIVIDHINEDKLDNRVTNLQIITQRENCVKSIKNSTSKYPGVHFNKKMNKWKSVILINKKYYYLGYFTNEEEAHKAYQNKLKTIL